MLYMQVEIFNNLQHVHPILLYLKNTALLCRPSGSFPHLHLKKYHNTMQKIIVIGGGLSGILLTINLIRKNDITAHEITVIEKDPPGMLGPAYSTNKHFHLLNVPACKMSAFPDKENDFTDWLNEMGYSFQAMDFVPRKIFRTYIQHTLQKVLTQSTYRGIRCRFLHDTVTDIDDTQGLVLLNSGRQLLFDKIILATGNYSSGNLHLDNNAYLKHSSYFSRSWDNQLFHAFPPGKKVFILGTGLTMADTVIGLREHQHKNEITALSVHGFTPLAHCSTGAYELPATELRNISSALDALKMVNRHIKKARKQNISWHAVIDAVRPFAQQIWLNLTVTEKRKFMEHLRHIWGVARHRMPPQQAAILQQLVSEKKLCIISGRVQAIAINEDDRFHIVYRERASGKDHHILADVIINCMGPESNYHKLEDPLIKSLFKKGLIRTDALRLGLDCTPEGRIIDQTGLPSAFLYVIGPPAKGILWEITSVPEIRSAAVQLASLLTSTKVSADVVL